MPDILTLSNALQQAGSGKKHVLLGNGFSRACRNDIFDYNELFNRADFTNLSSNVRQAFKVLKTTDFEVAMESLKAAAKLVKLYTGGNPDLAQTLEKDAGGLREVLVSAIAGSHPAKPGDIGKAQYVACKEFLENFNNIYTLNYDMLLYWALMQDKIAPKIPCDDGFREPENGACDWVTWDSSAHGQNIHYLHGALHIYESGPEIQKFTWCQTHLCLIDQIRDALENGKYPLFVAEGSSDQKMARINHSSFLGRSYRSLENVGGSLFIYGMSFGESDNHILRAISRSKVTKFFVSIYGDIDSATNKTIIKQAETLVGKRHNSGRRNPVEVAFYDAASAKVWG